MALHYHFGLLVLLACFCFEVTSRPSNNESPVPFKVEIPSADIIEENYDKSNFEDLSEELTTAEPQIENTQNIIDKIKAINDKLIKPQRQQLNYNAPLYTGGPYILDKAILEKIQQIIASGKLHGVNGPHKHQETNSFATEGLKEGSPRALRFVPSTLSTNILEPTVALAPFPYFTHMPVLVTPTPLSGYSINNELNSIQPTVQYSTRQRPSLPFQIQWPLAPFFPVLIKDPLLHYLQGGTWETLVDYGQNADVCNRQQKSSEGEENDRNKNTNEDGSDDVQQTIQASLVDIISSREGRKMKNIKKRTVSKGTSLQILNEKSKSPIGVKPSQMAKASASKLQSLNDIKNLQNLFQKQTTPKPVKKVEHIQDTKNSNSDEGDLRFPFGDFTFFGNRRPVAPSPGFFINRLKVRRGGVAIAGPGGVATAGRGGTALVGPGGLAYTQPGGLAVAGPAARVVALSSDADLNSVITRLQQQASVDGSVPRLLQAIPEGKVVATGPVVYYHPFNV